MPTYQPGVELIDQFYLLGTKFRREIRNAIIKADLSASIGQVTQVDMAIVDRDFKILESGIIAEGMRADFIGMAFSLSSITTSDANGVELIDLKFRPWVVRLLMDRQGVLSMSNVSPTQFVAAECAAVGASFVGQPSQVRNQVSRDVAASNTEGERPMSSWTTFNRLAQELGYVLFEFRGTVYFGKPSWLIANLGDPLEVNYTPRRDTPLSCLGVPSCSRNLDDTDGDTIGVALPLHRAETIGLGQKIRLGGVPTFDQDFLVSGVDYSILDPGAVIGVSAQRPVDPPIYTNTFGGSGVPTTYGTKGTRQSRDFMAWLIAQLGDRYVFGAPTEFANNDPGQFDCSSLVQWACNQVGVYMPRTTYEQEPYCLRNGTKISMTQAGKIAGAILFSEQNQSQGIGHVAISLGNNRDTIEAMNQQAGVCKGRFTWQQQTPQVYNRFRAAYLIPNMLYPQAELHAAGLTKSYGFQPYT